MTQYIVRDTPPTFAELTGFVSQSTIAIAVGTRIEDDIPNIVGTGFATQFSEIFASCHHVLTEHDNLSKLSDAKLNELGFKDSTLRIAIPTPEGYLWRAVEKGTWLRSLSVELDISILKIIGISIPPLRLGKSDTVFGTEVGIMGFPLGNQLQGEIIRPFVLKTVISGGLEATPANRLQSPRIALGTAVAGGFSGGPVFSNTDGTVLGMVASKTMELHIDEENSTEHMWPAGISLAISSGTLINVIRDVLPTFSQHIKQSILEKIDI